MNHYPTPESIELNRFKTISDFKWCDDADEVLEYVIDEDRLRDIIPK